MTMAMTTTVGQYLSAAETDRRLRRSTHHYVSDMIEYFGPERVFASRHKSASQGQVGCFTLTFADLHSS